MTVPRMSIRGLLTITALVAGFFAAHQYAPSFGGVLWLMGCYLLLPTIGCIFYGSMSAETQRSLIAKSVGAAFFVLIAIMLVAGDLGLVLVIVSQIFLWPLQLATIGYLRRQRSEKHLNQA